MNDRTAAAAYLNESEWQASEGEMKRRLGMINNNYMHKIYFSTDLR